MANNYDMDPSRIPAQLLSGIGFIGAGTILRDGINVKGLTTAAGLLSVTCIGLSIGAGFYLGGIFATIIVYFILSYSYKIFEGLDHFDTLELQIEVKENLSDTLTKIENILTEYKIEIKSLKLPNENDEENNTINIISHYNKKDINKNQLITKLTALESISQVLENT